MPWLAEFLNLVDRYSSGLVALLFRNFWWLADPGIYFDGQVAALSADANATVSLVTLVACSGKLSRNIQSPRPSSQI